MRTLYLLFSLGAIWLIAWTTHALPFFDWRLLPSLASILAIWFFGTLLFINRLAPDECDSLGSDR